ncbi:hypothetical protein ES705_37235 [subsurface metagenome]
MGAKHKEIFAGQNPMKLFPVVSINIQYINIWYYAVWQSVITIVP